MAADPWAALPDPYAGTTPAQRATWPLTPALVTANHDLLRRWSALLERERVARMVTTRQARKKEPR